VIVGLAVLLVLFTAALFFFRIKHRSTIKEMEIEGNELSLIVSFNHISLLKGVTRAENIGMGKFGHLFLGSWNDTKVILKRLDDKKNTLEFQRDAVQCYKCPHPYLLQFLGRYQDELLNDYAVVEYFVQSSLRNFLEKDSMLKIDLKVFIMTEIAKGLSHISKKIHTFGILSIDSILIVSNDTDDSNEKKVTMKLGDLTNIEIDSQRDKNIFSDTIEGEIYRFGLVSLQILDFNHFANSVQVDVQDLLKPLNCPTAIWSMILSCLNTNTLPKKPSVFTILQTLRKGE